MSLNHLFTYSEENGLTVLVDDRKALQQALTVLETINRPNVQRTAQALRNYLAK